MNHVSWLLHSLVLSSFISSIYSHSEYPLTFNPRTLELYELKDITKADPKDERVCVVVCPAQDENEKNFYKNVSMRYKSLFLQKITTVYDQITNPIKCEHSFELTLLVHSRKDGKFLEFGYEVYFEKSKFSIESIKYSDPSNFWEAVHEENVSTRAVRWISDIHITKNERQTELKKWGLVWIPKIILRYSVTHLYLKSLKYVIHPTITTNELMMKCSNYDLASSILNSVDGKLFENYYDASQAILFKEINTPEGSCNYFKNDCVKKYSVLLPYHYRTLDPEAISCSNLTSVTIWNHTLADELMERIKIFLIAVSKVANRPLIVLPGVIDILSLPKAGKKNDYRLMYLDMQHKKLPIPRLVYKLVRYRSHECDEKNELCWFNVVIVIQNNPDPTAAKLCQKDKCQEWGWDYVQLSNIDNRDEVNEFVYCCRLTKKIANLINFNMSKTEEEDLNLNHFPKYVEGKMKYFRIQKDFEMAYEEIEKIMSK